jgi:hypothetical protein
MRSAQDRPAPPAPNGQINVISNQLAKFGLQKLGKEKLNGKISNDDPWERFGPTEQHSGIGSGIGPRFGPLTHPHRRDRRLAPMGLAQG